MGTARFTFPRLLSSLDRPADALRHLGPNWFASVMGTGIVANAAVLLPRQVPGLRSAALAVWVLAAVLLLALVAATVAHWIRHPANARRHALDATMAPFYGAPPMALLTVGAGALLIGHELTGMTAAVIIDLSLWTLGTVAGLITAAVVPYLMFTRHELGHDDTSATWLMPIVPPMVSAAAGAALIQHLPAGEAQLLLLIACYAMFGLSLIASLITVTLLWARMAFHAMGPSHAVPTLWIVLGPLGQSITAANLLGSAAPGILPRPYDSALTATGLVYGIPTWGFALLWLALASALTLRAAREHLPFNLTWWSFTFPVGTVVTGTSELAAHSGAATLAWAAVALFCLLIGAWATAAANTLRGVFNGRLFLPPEPQSATA